MIERVYEPERYMQSPTQILITVVVGVLLGVLTRLADNQENALTWLGSLTTPWVLIAFALGAFSATWRRAVASAVSAMVIGVVVYYAWMRLIEGGFNVSYFLSLTAFWLLLAPAAGIVFGLAGWFWRDRGVHWLIRTLAVAIPAGIIAGESAFMAFTSRTLTDGEVTLLSLLITGGLMMPVILLRGVRNRLTGLAMTAAFLLVGLATVPLLRWLVHGVQDGQRP